MNPNFSDIVTTTLKNYRPTLVDNVTGNQVLVHILKQKGLWEEKDGGETIVEPLLVGLNNTVKSYHGWDLLDLTPQEGLTAAEFEWKQIAGSLSISGREEFQNSGSKTRIISLLEAKTKQLEISMQLEFNKQLFGDGTGNNGKDIGGLNLLVENGSAWSTVGGIDSSQYSFWRPVWVDHNNTALDLVKMTTVFNSVSRSKSKPTIIITTQAIYEDYEELVRANQGIVRGDAKLGDVGFQSLLFKDVPIVFDEDCPSGTMFFLNADFLKFVVGKGRNFKVTPLERSPNQDAKFSLVFLYGNMIINNRRRQGRIDNIAA